MVQLNGAGVELVVKNLDSCDLIQDSVSAFRGQMIFGEPEQNRS